MRKGKQKTKEDKDYTAMMELRTRMLLRNAVNTKSEVTLADAEVLRHIAMRLGYDLIELAKIDITDPQVNPFALMPPAEPNPVPQPRYVGQCYCNNYHCAGDCGPEDAL